ncbi:ABC transporter permease [Pigmentiphaga litoralis]|uniref:Sulfonate transport system permease protein n=1 Tax=Pigmentiphaga litoralis TaxID=516702 RepID=A0A7Y9LMI4_9BURK|nr:ABC transporter permease [Pigmentiphaga litoralis]NYE22728.1 sulfonate transport system permease protein [Pigmentiphaga litoralis]NYE83657.1 sulfonate transport system permease protein [Pigmentiphaga litoralis]
MSSLPLGSVPLDSLTQPSAPLPSTWVRALRPSALNRRVRAVATGLLLPAMVVLLWAVAAHAEWVAPQILPDPSLVLATAVELMASGQLQQELAVSFGRLMVGLLIGGGLGLAVGIAMGVSRRVEVYLGPTVRAFWLVPSLGWLPFFMLFFGIGETLKFVLIAKTCFLPLMINSFDGVRNVSLNYRDVARVLELDRWSTLRHVVLPAILPAVFNGFRLALSKGWKALILVEMIASAAGIGYLMTWGRKAFQLDIVLVTMVVIALAGWALDYAAMALQKRHTAWAGATA